MGINNRVRLYVKLQDLCKLHSELWIKLGSAEKEILFRTGRQLDNARNYLNSSLDGPAQYELNSVEKRLAYLSQHC